MSQGRAARKPARIEIRRGTDKRETEWLAGTLNLTPSPETLVVAGVVRSEEGSLRSPNQVLYWRITKNRRKPGHCCLSGIDEPSMIIARNSLGCEPKWKLDEKKIDYVKNFDMLGMLFEATNNKQADKLV